MTLSLFPDDSLIIVNSIVPSKIPDALLVSDTVISMPLMSVSDHTCTLKKFIKFGFRIFISGLIICTRFVSLDSLFASIQ